MFIAPIRSKASPLVQFAPDGALPSAQPAPTPLQTRTIPGKIIGKSTPSSLELEKNRKMLSPNFLTRIENYIDSFRNPVPVSPSFERLRNRMLSRIRKMETWTAISANSPARPGEDESFGIQVHENLTQEIVANNRPQSADPYISFPSEVLKRQYIETTQTNAIFGIKSISDLLGSLGDASTITDLIITGHGDGSAGMWLYETQYTMDDIKRLVSSLFNKGKLVPGSRVLFTTCKLAGTQPNKNILQSMANEFGIHIIAFKDNYSPLLPYDAKRVDFFPQDAAKFMQRK